MLDFFCFLIISIATKNELFEKIIKLVKTSTDLTRELRTKNKNVDPIEIIEHCNDLVCNRLQEYSTKHKREQIRKELRMVVPPNEYHMTTYWDHKTRTDSMQLKSSTFQLLPIVEQIQSIFSCLEFEKKHMEHNQSHICEEGEFSEYCCSDNYGKCEFFKENQLAIQLQLATDDFEPTSALKPKTLAYKVYGIYGSILNISISLRSKNEIYFWCVFFFK